jgi:hypothetical protein
MESIVWKALHRIWKSNHNTSPIQKHGPVASKEKEAELERENKMLKERLDRLEMRVRAE